MLLIFELGNNAYADSTTYKIEVKEEMRVMLILPLLLKAIHTSYVGMEYEAITLQAWDR